ncbi:hypothetical protein TcCL_NonESM04574 [Trypanosoma cruzi]|nr:hypothetical protein TcCL_NonESM04574 [Trypanosoma cruzi]
MVRVLLCLLSVSGTVNATTVPPTHFSVAAAVVSATPDVALRDGEALLLCGGAKVDKTPPEALGTSGGHIYEYQRRVCISMFISRVVAFCTRPWRMKLLLFSLFAALGIPFAPTFCWLVPFSGERLAPCVKLSVSASVCGLTVLESSWKVRIMTAVVTKTLMCCTVDA